MLIIKDYGLKDIMVYPIKKDDKQYVMMILWLSVQETYMINLYEYKPRKILLFLNEVKGKFLYSCKKKTVKRIDNDDILNLCELTRTETHIYIRDIAQSVFADYEETLEQKQQEQALLEKSRNWDGVL